MVMDHNVQYKGIPLLVCSQDNLQLKKVCQEWKELYPCMLYEPFKTLSRSEKEGNLAVKEVWNIFSKKISEPTSVVFSLQDASVDVQNALLIVLEKLNPLWRPLLIVNNIHGVIPTILSRTKTVYLRSLLPLEMNNFALQEDLNTEFIPLAKGSMEALVILNKFSHLINNNNLSEWVTSFADMDPREILTLMNSRFSSQDMGWAQEMISKGEKPEWVLASIWN